MSNILSGVLPVRAYKMSGISKAGTQYAFAKLEYLVPSRSFSNEKTNIVNVGYDLREINLDEQSFVKFSELPFLTHVDFVLTCDPRDPTKNIVSDWKVHE